MNANEEMLAGYVDNSEAGPTCNTLEFENRLC